MQKRLRFSTPKIGAGFRLRLVRVLFRDRFSEARELEPRSGDAGADAADTGLMERAEWAEPGSMTDSY